MKTPDLQQVVRAARALPEDSRVPFAFEKRVMALLRSRQRVDVWAGWSSAMWRAALAGVAISLLTGALARFDDEPVSALELLSADLEQTVLSSITPEETW